MTIPFKSVAMAIGFYLAYSPSALSHGWTEFPEARQSICYEQGGLWNGDIPNQACKDAWEKSGVYPFVQRNEVAINIPYPDYEDIEIVKQRIPDGTLCYANDNAKAGLGINSTEWTRTEVGQGRFELVFKGTAPHNPSYWEIYLTKQGTDLSKPLRWDDLESD
ncbi:lytic polysaccharide monooxygenase [Vibrio mediterranei]|uniref:lytic polysaccharide monooxygenase n=1 Tax=Vibrio mediterranei TaxID=689 RepID=UPI0038CE772B